MNETQLKGGRRKRPPSRTQRWADAASAAATALEALQEIQQEYQEALDNLPENLHSSPYGEKLNAVCELDIEGALSTVQDADGIDLPLGFGRD